MNNILLFNIYYTVLTLKFYYDSFKFFSLTKTHLSIVLYYMPL